MEINYVNLIMYLSVMGITPGPNNLTCLYLGGRQGLKRCMPFILTSGFCIFLKSVVCGVFSRLLATYLPQAVNAVKWLGALYMLYLAYHMIRSGFEKEAVSGENGKNAEERAGSGIGARREGSPMAAVVLQLLNGKSWTAALSVFAVYVTPFTAKLSVSVLVAAIFMIIVLLCSVVWALGGSAFKKLISEHKAAFGIIMGASLIYCAVTAVL